MTTITRTTPLAEALNANRSDRLNRLLKHHGIGHATLNAWATGQHQPAPWIARQIASALDHDPADLFPNQP